MFTLIPFFELIRCLMLYNNHNWGNVASLRVLGTLARGL